MGHTGQWIILWLSLHGVVCVYEPPSLRECCEDGRAKAQERHDCTVHPLISSFKCSIVYEQCCRTVEQGLLCDQGIQMARDQGACERPFFEGDGHETQTAKMCCDCCSLGVAASSDGSSCDLSELLLGRVCVYVAQSCCLQNTTVIQPEVEPTEPPGESHGCADSVCEQLCVGDGECACHDGFELQEDGIHCEDINECLIGSHNCDYGLICLNTEGSFRCRRENSCDSGFELTEDNTCKDIDECKLGTHHCGPSFVCINTAGSFSCLPKDKCADGYVQDAVGTCIDINECVLHSNPCKTGQTCVNTIGSFVCHSQPVSCGQGYHLVEDGTRCEDINECQTDNVCGVHHCVNLVGSYSCECLTGFSFNRITKVCEDINECVHNAERPCAHKCENTEGSFECSCTTGFKLASDGRTCEDINECDENPCSQECTNVFGSFQCYCRPGYQLSDADGVTCEDIDECALPIGRKACPHYCVNTPGSFNCTCPPGGFEPTPNGHKCQDIDECEAGTHTCSASEQCYNIQGGFRCLSFTCPDNFRRAASGPAADSSLTVRCAKDCKPQDKHCVLDPIHLITHTVLSLPTFRSCRRPEEIVVLRTTAPANPDTGNAIDVFFSLLATDDHFSFDVSKRSKAGMIIGVIRQVKPIVGPKDIVLEVAINYVKAGVVTHRNIVMVYVFICQYWY